MLAIDVRDCHLTVSMPHRHGGVATMLIALGHARIGVTRIEPRGEECGVYCLTVNDSPDLAVSILERLGCQVARPASDLIGDRVTRRASGYNMTGAGRSR